MFNFTPLLGAQSTSPASQSLLEFDGGIKILIDVGWDESFDVEKLKELERYDAPWSNLSPLVYTRRKTFICYRCSQTDLVYINMTIGAISHYGGQQVTQGTSRRS